MRFLRRYYKWFLVIIGFFTIIGLEAEQVEPYSSMFALGYFMMLSFFAIRWLVKEIKFVNRLKKENKQAELLHLKTQVSPHFFFNTLNNLYGLVGKNPEKAQEVILELSDMMRYSIYDGQRELVTLQEEIDFIENYISLHKMRYHKRIDVQLDVTVEDPKLKVMPLLFIILLENAFKHGVEKLRTDAYVHLSLKATESTIDFIIVNNFDAEEIDEHTGVGLANLRRRLALVYPKQHELTITKNANKFKAGLKLNIS